jgi:hypothetical protein
VASAFHRLLSIRSPTSSSASVSFGLLVCSGAGSRLDQQNGCWLPAR